MSEILQANIFFYITSVAVVVVTALIVVVLFYVVSILRNVKDVSDKVKQGSDALSQDLSSIRKTVKREKLRLQQIIDFFIIKFTPKRKATRSKKTESSGK